MYPVLMCIKSPLYTYILKKLMCAVYVIIYGNRVKKDPSKSIILGFFINSSSGLAVLSIPIMAPLADAVGLPREVVITAYMFGQGTMGFVTPTGLILVVLELVHVGYDKYLKFVAPLVAMVVAFSLIFLCIQVAIV